MTVDLADQSNMLSQGEDDDSEEAETMNMEGAQVGISTDKIYHLMLITLCGYFIGMRG